MCIFSRKNVKRDGDKIRENLFLWVLFLCSKKGGENIKWTMKH